MVTVFAFDDAMQIKEGSGWWGSVHWQVVTSREGKPLVLVAEKQNALTVAQTALTTLPILADTKLRDEFNLGAAEPLLQK